MGDASAKVIVLMGSKSDLEQGEKITIALDRFGVRSEMRIASAHKSPHHLLRMLEAYEADGAPKVYITIAGRSNALSGMVDAQVTAPVIACPPYSERFAGADLYSSLRMPSGVAPAVVLEPEGAALLAVKILAMADKSLLAAVERVQKGALERIVADDAEMVDRSGAVNR